MSVIEDRSCSIAVGHVATRKPARPGQWGEEESAVLDISNSSCSCSSAFCAPRQQHAAHSTHTRGTRTSPAHRLLDSHPPASPASSSFNAPQSQKMAAVQRIHRRAINLLPTARSSSQGLPIVKGITLNPPATHNAAAHEEHGASTQRHDFNIPKWATKIDAKAGVLHMSSRMNGVSEHVLFTTALLLILVCIFRLRQPQYPDPTSNEAHSQLQAAHWQPTTSTSHAHPSPRMSLHTLATSPISLNTIRKHQKTQ